MSSPRKKLGRLLLKLAQLSPLLGASLVALVWFSVPSDIAPGLVSTDNHGVSPLTRAEWVSSADDSKIWKAFGLSGDSASLDAAADQSWTNWTDSLGSHPASRAVFSPPIASADATAFAPIRRWERAQHAHVWAWVTPVPQQAAVVASATGNPSAAAQVRARFEEVRQSAASAGSTAPTDEVAWLWEQDVYRGGPASLAALSSDFTLLGETGGRSGGDYSSAAVSLQSAGRLWRALVVGSPTTEDVADPMPNLSELGALDPLDPHFADDVTRLAQQLKVNVWVLGPLSMRAIPLRVPDGATDEQAAQLGRLAWPSVAVATGQTSGLVPLSKEVARLAGGPTAFVHVTARNNSLTDAIGSSDTPDITPQTVAFMAVFDRVPSPPSAWRRAWMAWQRFVSSWFPFLLGGAVGLLALTLVLSPAAFVRERRVIARQRVREDMARMRRDAHDKVYNRLAALSKRVAATGDQVAASNAATLATIAEDIRTTVGELQNILGEEVRHTNGALTSMPLAEQLLGVCAAQSARLGVEVSCEPDVGLPDVNPALGWDLQCIAEEAITNAVRHGGATHVRVRVSTVDDALELDVADDGRGSNVLRVDDAPPESTGLRGMRDRVERHGGSLAIARGADGCGTTLLVRVPLSPDDEP